jgi:hypothetical protein
VRVLLSIRDGFPMRLNSATRLGAMLCLVLMIISFYPRPVWALPERVCDKASLGPVNFELCEARRLDEQAAALRARASGFESMARLRNPKCDDETSDPARLVGCDMAVRDMSREAGFIRLEAEDKQAQADARRTKAEALLGKGDVQKK